MQCFILKFAYHILLSLFCALFIILKIKIKLKIHFYTHNHKKIKKNLSKFTQIKYKFCIIIWKYYYSKGIK